MCLEEGWASDARQPALIHDSLEPQQSDGGHHSTNTVMDVTVEF